MDDCRDPLVADLDGTLIKTDTLWEQIIWILLRQPWKIFIIVRWIVKGRAYLKFQMAQISELDPAKLPYNDEFLRYLKAEYASGRKIVLATAATMKVAHSIADYLGIFSSVLASNKTINLKGEKKGEALVEQFSSFAYAGNDKSDISVWKRSQEAIIVNAAENIYTPLPGQTLDLRFKKERKPWQPVLQAIRIKHWSKNLLVFIPLLLGSNAEFLTTMRALFVFILFSLLCSANYILNDLIDINHDRDHPQKKGRPLASGNLAIPDACMIAALLTMVAFTGAGLLSHTIFMLFGLYLMSTNVYSFLLKKFVILDVLSLASFYTMRLFIGAAAIQVGLSYWLCCFSIFWFFSLAMLKRVSDLRLLAYEGGAVQVGRGILPTT